MPEVHDKRRKTDLDLFVLALVDSGVATPYALQITAGLSPGASIPALQRLAEAGLVRQGKPGSRGRTEHRVTPAGKKLLKTGWQSLIEDGPSGDLDSDLRVALLALASGEHRLAKDFLERSAARKFESISALERPGESDSLPPLAFWYRELRSDSAKVMLRGGSAAALAMAEALPRKLTKSNRRTRRTITR
jgi:DNA-binding PadR family transcriptional regulator